MNNDNFLIVNYPSDMDIKDESGRRIRAAREAKGLRLRDVSDAVGETTCGIQQLSNFEHGRRMVSVEIAKEIASALDVTPEYILTLTNTPKPDARETELIALYRSCDYRGKLAILRMAQQEQQLSDEAKSERRGPENDDHYSGPERRRHH